MSNKSDHPLVKKFREGAMVCNDWRDTIFYTATLAGLAAVPHLHLGDTGATIEQVLTTAPVLRECLRAVAWMIPNIIQDGSNVIEPVASVLVMAVATAGMSVANVSMFDPHPLQVLCAPDFVKHMALGLGGAFVFSYGVGGPKGVYKLYKDKLFDYPRKIKPPTQRRPKKNVSRAIRNLIEKIKEQVEGLLPQPGLRPIPIPVPVSSSGRRLRNHI